jgi:predicted metal-binding membrane protein
MLSANAHLPAPRPALLLTWSAIAAAWVATLLLVGAGGSGAIMNHDAVLDHRQIALPAAILLFLASWQLMTAAMMLPASMPMLAAFLRVARRQPHPNLAFGGFLLGYVAVWTAFAVVALASDTSVHWVADNVRPVGERPWLIGGATLVLAGAFQFSSLKERCLDSCRNPLAFLWTHYTARRRSAWRLGVRHGLFCLGCCWALMLTMFAVGMGNMVWMTALAGVMLIEKTTRYGRRLATPIGGLLIVSGALVMGNVDGLAAIVPGP